MALRRLKGLPKVLDNLNKEVKKIENGTLKGLIRAGIIVRRSMDENVPKIPIDLGNLRAGYFTVTNKGGISAGRNPQFKEDKGGKLASGHQIAVNKAKGEIQGRQPTIMLGFSAAYALYVHEMIEGTFQRPGAGAKFFEVALDSNEKRILEVIRKEAKIK
jgi:hypothetical protein